MTSMFRTTGAAALTLCLLAGSAAASLPAALDRVPGDALVAIGIRDIDQLKSDTEAVLAMLPSDIDTPAEFDQLDEILELEAIRTNGSLAIAMVAPPEGAEEPAAVVIAPVIDYGGFITSLGGQADGISEIDAFGRTVYVKDAGDGYAVISPYAAITEGFDAAAGNTPVHKQRMGDTGFNVADGADFIVVANIQALAPQIKAAAQEQMAEAAQMAEMAGPQAEQLKQSLAFGEVIVEGFTRDATAGILAADLGEHGWTVDLAANFTEGSELAGFFSAAGDAAGLLAKLPASQYYFAGAYDISSDGLRTILGNLLEAGSGMAAQAGLPAMDWDWALDAEGGSYVMGAAPNIMGLMMGGGSGLLGSTYGYVKTGDADAFRAGMKNYMTTINGMEQEGVAIASTYTENVADGVDGWSMATELDPTNPMAAQMQQINGILYGGSGPGGLIASGGEGLVFTFGDDQNNLGNAVKTANGELANLGDDAGITALADRIPENASALAFVGFDGILGSVSQVMMMMGGGAGMQPPANLPPAAFAAVTDNGGFHLRLVVDSASIKGISGMIEAMQAAPADAPAGGPNF